MADGYRPQEYWSARLAGDFTLRGVGHHDYTEGYNRWLYRQKHRALDRAITVAPAGARALDVGSGVGWVVDDLAARGFRVSGCDIADVAVDRLRATRPASAFFRLGLGTDPVPAADGAFALVTMLDVAYHVVDPELWRRGLAELARVLRADGELVVTDQLGDAPHRPNAHVQFRSRAEWADAAAGCGLRVARTGPLFRWLSRPRGSGAWHRMPDGARGAAEYALERAAPIAPHMRWAVLVRG